MNNQADHGFRRQNITKVAVNPQTTYDNKLSYCSLSLVAHNINYIMCLSAY